VGTEETRLTLISLHLKKCGEMSAGHSTKQYTAGVTSEGGVHHYKFFIDQKVGVRKCNEVPLASYTFF
jgi:hypothetical protein